MNKALQFTDEHHLWAAFCQGNEAAYRQLYEQYVPGLYSYGMKLTRDEALVKDCVQELFIRIWNTRQALGQAKSIKFYLSSALRRDLIRQLQQQKTLTPDELEAYDFTVSLDTEALFIQQEIKSEQVERLNQLLNGLPPRQKEALYLKYYENLSYEEIAGLMHITPGVAYNFVYRAILSLKKYWLTTQIIWLFVGLA